jgi:hypothetical protein
MMAHFTGRMKGYAWPLRARASEVVLQASTRLRRGRESRNRQRRIDGTARIGTPNGRGRTAGSRVCEQNRREVEDKPHANGICRFARSSPLRCARVHQRVPAVRDRVVMITGDQPRICIKAAREVDLVDEEGDAPVVLGSGLEDVEDLSGGKVERIRETCDFRARQLQAKIGRDHDPSESRHRRIHHIDLVLVRRMIRVSGLSPARLHRLPVKRRQ